MVHNFNAEVETTIKIENFAHPKNAVIILDLEKFGFTIY